MSLLKGYMEHNQGCIYPTQEISIKLRNVTTAYRELLSLFMLCPTLHTRNPCALHQYVSEPHRTRHTAMPNSILKGKKVKTVGVYLAYSGE